VDIGRVFHYTPLVEDLPAAEAFFETFFAPHCFYRGYSPHWHRQAAIYVMGEFVIEPLQPLPPEGDAPASSWYRFMERYGERVLNVSFYATDLPGLAARLAENGIGSTDAGNPSTLFIRPKEFPGSVEFFDPTLTGGMPDPRRAPSWSSAYWRDFHPLGLHHASHITCVVADHRAAAKRYVDALGSVVLPDQPARTPHARSTFVTVGSETVIELAQPEDADCPLAADLERVGDSICGVTFRVADLAAARAFIERSGGEVTGSADGTLAFDRSVTFGSDYAFTDRPLEGDPRVWT
jgi:hypothetical protein